MTNDAHSHLPTEPLDDDDVLTPADRARFVDRIARIAPYDDGLDAKGNLVSPEEFVADLLTDIRHYCAVRHLDFAACDSAAHSHYLKERASGKEDVHG